MLVLHELAEEHLSFGVGGPPCKDTARRGEIAAANELALSSADVELDRGVLQIVVSDPMDVPMERLSVSGRIGTMFLDRLGNASPETLDLHHGLGAARVDLQGQWRNDADIDFQVAFGTGELRLPGDVTVAGMGRALAIPPDRELPPPTLQISTHFDIGDIRVIR